LASHSTSLHDRYLGKTGKCHVEETDKGWYIKYIDRDPEALARAVLNSNLESSIANRESNDSYK